MKIKRIKLEGHPGIGDLALSFCDDQTDTPFNIVVLAGGNGTGKTAILDAIQRAFEGNLSLSADRVGVVSVTFATGAEDLTNIEKATAIPDIGNTPSTEFTLRYDSNITNDWRAFSLSWTNTLSQPVQLSPILIQEQKWRNVFRSFFSEANVNFNPQIIQSITGRIIDDPSIKVARSGNNIATEITQLLVDIRAADNEDLAKWVEQNPEKLPPDAVKAVRMSRFIKAFNRMFPTKRFKEIRHDPSGHIVEFEEAGRITSIAKLSTGEKQIVFRAGFLLKNLSEAKSSIVLIDEPELSLHPEWQEGVVSFYTSLLSNKEGEHPQIIISTHSPFIVHGAAGAKTIVLEKDKTGNVIEMPAPTYPVVGGYEAICAFNIDGFLSSAQKPLLILTEGKSDVELFQAAWEKRRPGKRMDFELRPALGMKNINITLNDEEVFSRLGNRKLLGVFDFDDAYNHWNGVWRKNSISFENDVAKGLTKQYKTRNGWAMLLPVPQCRCGYASEKLKGKSILSVEFLFNDDDIPPGMIDYVEGPLNQKIPVFKKDRKMEFSELVKTYSSEKFSNFEPLLSAWEKILEYGQV